MVQKQGLYARVENRLKHEKSTVITPNISVIFKELYKN